jgi:penicillin amidase
MEEWVAALKDQAAAALRPLDGTVSLQGFPGEARITTDRWGVPHVDASTRDAMYAAQGYLHATERMWQVEFMARIAQGRLSELVGEPGFGVDRYFRTLGLGRTAQRWVDEGLDEDSERIGRAYHAGFVAGANSVPLAIEFQILGAQPDVPQTFEEAAARRFAHSLLIAFGLSMNWTLELLRFQLAKELGPEKAMLLTPFMGQAPPHAIPQRRNDTGAVADLLKTARSFGSGAPGIGSNNWVLAGSRTTTGAPLLCNDPHLLVQMPAIWTEMHLRCPNLNVAGASFPGIPGILIGHNDRIAWGFTNTQADVTDLYLERLNDDETKYEYDGEWLPVETRHEHIHVRNEPEPRVLEVRSTRHGPIITDLVIGSVDTHVRENAVGAPLALRWIHYDQKISQGPIEALNAARNFDEFRAAALRWPSVGQNMVYADVDGHIGYQLTGTYPIRGKGSGVAPSPGWDPAYEWTGTIPVDDLPWAFDPPAGFLATANNKVVADDYPYHLTHDWEPAWRITRIHDVLRSREKHSADDMAALQRDAFSGIADALLSKAPVPHELLRNWNRHMDAEQSAAALFAVWLDELARALFHKELGDELFDLFHTNRSWVSAFSAEAVLAAIDGNAELCAETLQRAWDRLADMLGPDSARWRWGSLHQITFAHPIARALPPLAELFNAGPYEVSGGDDTVNRGTYSVGENFQTGGISSYRQIVDLGDFDRSRSVITTGCSGNPASPYYANQTPLWLHGEHHPMLFTPDAIQSEAVGTLVIAG